MDERTALLQRVDPAANTKKLAKFRNVVYFSTFIAYAMSHFSRKCYTNVKVELRSIGVDPILLSQMDTAFMFTYAVGKQLTCAVAGDPCSLSLIAQVLFSVGSWETPTTPPPLLPWV